MAITSTKFRSIFIVFITGCLSIQAVQAQKPKLEKITGNVVTTDGKAAESISVALKGTFYGTTTDANGNFSFDAPAGDHTLVAFSITCHAKELPVSVKKGGPNNFPGITVKEDLKQLEDVVVTGQFSPQSLRNSVYKVKVIGSEQIERKGAQDIQSLLNTEIGIRFSNETELGETDLEIMGMGGNNVKVLVDGMPVIDRNATKQSLDQIDISTVDRVEIVEGPMSVVYGTDALAGVINIITKKPDPADGKNAWGVNASVTEESAGSEYKPFAGEGLHRQNIRLNWSGKSGIYAQVSAMHLGFGGWQGDSVGRALTWPGKDQLILNSLAGYGKDGLDIWYKIDYSENETFKYYNALPGSTQEKDESFITDRMNHQLHGQWKASNRVSINAAASYQTLERRTKTVIKDTGNEWLSGEPGAQDTAKMQDFFARATLTWGITPKLSLQPGVDFEWTKASGDRIIGSPIITDFAAYVSAEWEATEWLDVRSGLRTQYNSAYNAPPVIPSLQAKFMINPAMDLRLSYGYGFRAPKLRELYFRFVNGRHDISGNPNLKAEHSNNLSAAFTWRILHEGDIRLTSTITGFYNDFRDRISMVITDASSFPIKATYRNISHDKTAGGTLDNTLAWKSLEANLSFSMVGRYNILKEDPGYKDADMSAYRFSPEISANINYTFEKTGTSLNLFYKYNHNDREYYLVKGRIELLGKDGFNWADFTVAQKVGGYVTLTAAVKNIFNVTLVKNSAGGGMSSIGSTGASTASYQGYGTSFMLGARFAIMK